MNKTHNPNLKEKNILSYSHSMFFTLKYNHIQRNKIQFSINNQFKSHFPHKGNF